MENKKTMQLDYKIILDLIKNKSSVLDLGCGDGELLRILSDGKNIKSQGVEIDEQAIYKCVEKGLNVLHENIDTSLPEYKDKSFDYVIMNQSLQQVLYLEEVLDNALRVGKQVIVGFPNFTYYRARLQILFLGRTPVTPALPYKWYQTPNLHCLSIADFKIYCKQHQIRIEKALYLGVRKPVYLFPNFFANSSIFLISR